MDRKDFIKKSLFTTAAIGASFALGNKNVLFGQDKKNNSMPDLIAVRGGSPESMFDNGIKALGGIKQFVKKGQTVVIKPNIGWNKTFDYGANTNPKLVQRIAEHCIEAGAKRVYIFDHTCDNWKSTYKNSGIETAAKNAGAIVVPADTTQYYQEVTIPNAKILKKAMVHELILESDVFINVPVLKHHGGARLTIAMKNLMGVVWDRGIYHSKGLHECIADFSAYRKPDLNIVDAYTVMMKNGPRGVSQEDLKTMKAQLISTDMVAIDSAATKLYGRSPSDIPYITMANDKKIGTMNLESLNIKRIALN